MFLPLSTRAGELRQLQGRRSWKSTQNLLIKPNDADVILAVWTNTDAASEPVSPYGVVQYMSISTERLDFFLSQEHQAGYEVQKLSEVVSFFKPCALFAEQYNRSTMEDIARQSQSIDAGGRVTHAAHVADDEQTVSGARLVRDRPCNCTDILYRASN